MHVDDFKVCANFVGLKDKCIHPDTREPYILNASGGMDNSIEGKQVRSCRQAHQQRAQSLLNGSSRAARLILRQDGITHAFVIIFASVEDRDYYVNKDSAHLEFVESTKDFIEKATVVDYEPNVF